MNNDVYQVMKDKGITLPAAPSPMGLYTPIREFGANMAQSSGCGPIITGVPTRTGKVGSDLTLEEAQESARACMLNVLAALHSQIGDLNLVKRVVKVLAFVASADDFTSQPAVVNAASQLLIDVFGEEAGKGARSAIGVNVLPGNIPVEIEVLFELK